MRSIISMANDRPDRHRSWAGVGGRWFRCRVHNVTRLVGRWQSEQLRKRASIVSSVPDRFLRHCYSVLCPRKPCGSALASCPNARDGIALSGSKRYETRGCGRKCVCVIVCMCVCVSVTVWYSIAGTFPVV